MSFYPVTPCDVTCSSAEGAALGLLGQAGMVTVAVADLASPCRAGLGKDGRTALIAAGAGQIRSGELVVWLKPVVITPAVVRRDGRVQAAGRPAGHARLGLAEHALDELCGTPDVIGQVAAAAVAGEKVRGAARRAVTAALAIRFTLLMTLMGDADYAEVMDTLLGDLLLVPWQQPCRAPVAASACAWRKALGPAPLEQLRDMALAGIDAEHRDHDYRAVTVGDLDAGSIDGSLIRVPDTPASREAFGSAGTADDSAPYPQLRELRVSHASTRAALAVVTGPSGAAAGGSRDKGEAEQVLLDKALEDYPQVFTPGRIWIMDRNFPGVPRIKKMLTTQTHVLIRVKDGINLGRIGGFAPDGSYLASICGGGVTLAVRVIEYTVTVAATDAPELFCLITDLTDHETYPARMLAEAYHWRWIGSETALKEAKSAIAGAGPSTGPMLRSQSPALIAQEHAAWVVATELARATARAAAAIAVPARTGRHAGQPVHPRQISFTAARRAVLAATRSGTATASLPATLTAASRGRALAGLARRRVVTGRNRHRDRKTKARLGFPPAGPRLASLTAPAEISVCAPLAARSCRSPLARSHRKPASRRTGRLPGRHPSRKHPASSRHSTLNTRPRHRRNGRKCRSC